jgi:hypothetical protein
MYAPSDDNRPTGLISGPSDIRASAQWNSPMKTQTKAGDERKSVHLS